MLAAIKTFFGGPLGTIGIYVIMGLLACGIVFGYLELRDTAVQREALLKFNKEQLDQVIRDHRVLQENLKVLSETSKRIIIELDEKNDADAKRIEEVKKSIEELKDQNSSEILKRTIEGLEQLNGVKK